MAEQASLFSHAGKVCADQFTPTADVVFALGDAVDTLAQCPDEFASLIITSPPYNIGKAYESSVSLAQYIAEMSPILREVVRVLSPQGSLCWQVGNYVHNGEVFPLDIYFYPVFKEVGLQLRNRIIWTFEHGLHCSKRFSGRYETLLWFTKTDHYTFHLDPVRVPSKYPGKTHFKPGPKYGTPSGNPLGKNPGDLWRFVLQEWESEIWNIPNVKSNHPEKTLHPCQFPIELVERCVLALTSENDWVLDPFCGVGSSLLAAVRHKRRAMGCERVQEYWEEAQKRMGLLFSGTLPYRPLGKPIYQPTGHAMVEGEPFWLRGLVGAPGGRVVIRDEVRGPVVDAALLGTTHFKPSSQYDTPLNSVVCLSYCHTTQDTAMRHRSAKKSRRISRKARTFRQTTISVTTVVFVVLESHAQIVTDGTVGRAQTLKGPNYTISADLGTQRGANLFHSFQDFGLKTGESASFTGPTGLQNVVGRVTGGNLSSIDGILRSEIPNANVWLINPAGVLFGPNAQIDVPAAFHVSTADHLRFGDGALFSAQNPAKSTLTTAPIAAFGFLNATPATLRVTGGHLAVKEGQTLSLIGGGIDVENGILQAPAGQINVVAVGSAGEVSLTENGIGLDGFAGMGDIRIIRDAGVERPVVGDITLGDVDTSGKGGGAIVVRGGNMAMNGGMFFADTYGDQAGIGIDVGLLGDLNMERGSRITADAVAGKGTGGHINFMIANALDMRNGGEIGASTWDSGDAGAISIHAKRVLVDGAGPEEWTGIFSGAESGSTGASGNMSLAISESLDVRNGGIVGAGTWGSGNAGSVTVNAKNVRIDGAGTQEFAGILSGALAGSTGSSGHVHLTISELLDISNGGRVSAGTWGKGHAGTVTVDARNVSISGAASGKLTGISSGALEGSGSGGNIGITVADLLDIRNGGEVSAATFTLGNAGSVMIRSGNAIKIDNYAGIYVTSLGDGQAGNVTVTTPHFTLTHHSTVSGTSEKTSGGNLIINAEHIRLLDESLITASVYGDDAFTVGGNITLNGSNIVALNGSKIIAQSQFFGNDGNIFMNVNILLHNAKDFSDVVRASSAVIGYDSTGKATNNLGMSSSAFKGAGFGNALLCKKTYVPKKKRSRIVKVGRGALPADNREDITVSLAQNQWPNTAPTATSANTAPLRLSYTDCLPAPGEQGDGIATDAAKVQKPVGKRTGKRVVRRKKS